MDIQNQIKQLEESISKQKEELAELRRQAPAEEVKDYVFKDRNGKSVKLSDMFGEHKELIVIHNMGKSCKYCTLWADGITGLTPYLESRAGFALVSPDAPADMADFADSRKWTFKVYSSRENSFKKDLGFQEKAMVLPGVSTFKKNEDGKILHSASTMFGPGDNYCILYDLFDLLPETDESCNPGKGRKD